jgi:hypothetical protein
LEQALEEVSSQPVLKAFYLAGLGDAALQEGDLERAETYRRNALELLEQSGRRHNVPEHLAGFARVAFAGGDPERAAVLLGGSDALREQLEINVIAFEWPPPSETIAVVRAGLSDEAFSAAWGAGRALRYDEAVAYALERAIRL